MFRKERRRLFRLNFGKTGFNDGNIADGLSEKSSKLRRSFHRFSVNLYKEYASLKSRELEELPRFGVMSRQPF